MSDRVCIHSKGSVNVRISADDLVSCCYTCGMGCNGGFPGAAWHYWVKKGIVSGGSFGSHQGCRPYEIAPCEHHVNGTRPPCTGDDNKTPVCKQQCEKGYDVPYSKDKNYGQEAYSISSDVQQIQKEIMTNGPVEGAFEVYEDLLSYKKGKSLNVLIYLFLKENFQVYTNMSKGRLWEVMQSEFWDGVWITTRLTG